MEPHTFSDKEAEIYDRQIRLWGVEAQRQLRASKVLVVNCGALAAEVVKNIVLAGINVVLLDDQVAVEQDLGANFFLREADIGCNVS